MMLLSVWILLGGVLLKDVEFCSVRQLFHLWFSLIYLRPVLKPYYSRSEEAFALGLD